MLRAIGVAVTDELRISLEGVDRVPAHVKVVLAVTVALLGFVFVALRDSYSDDAEIGVDLRVADGGEARLTDKWQGVPVPADVFVPQRVACQHFPGGWARGQHGRRRARRGRPRECPRGTHVLEAGNLVVSWIGHTTGETPRQSLPSSGRVCKAFALHRFDGPAGWVRRQGSLGGGRDALPGIVEGVHGADVDHDLALAGVLVCDCRSGTQPRRSDNPRRWLPR